MINPNFKGQLTNCAGILPFTRGPDDNLKGGNLYQQHTAASQLKVNRRATGIGAQAAAHDDTAVALPSNRPFN